MITNTDSVQHNKVIALEVLQDDVKYISKETFYKTYFSCEQKPMFSCLVVKTKPIAVKFVKK